MDSTSGNWIGLCIGGAAALLLALLAVLGGVVAGAIPWIALPGVWLGGNALILLGALWRAIGTISQSRAAGDETTKSHPHLTARGLER